jgi:RNA recognition motif-containing protein
MILLSIENLSNETNEQEIERFFSCCGKVSSVKLRLGAPHSRYPGSGLIKMQGNDAARVISSFDGCLFKGMVLRVTELPDIDVADTNSSADSLDPTPPESIDDSGNSQHPPFRLISVEKTGDPALGSAENWHRYVIQSGKSHIIGLHRGTLDEVTEFAEDCVEAFNLRNRSKGRRSITWSSRSKK